MGAPGHDDAATHMDGIYRYQRYIYDLTRKYFLLGRDTMLDAMKPPAGGTVLEVGCGTGRNMILAAKRYPDADFYGFDISTMMLETADQNVARAGLAHRIKVAQGDATNFDAEHLFGIPAFDRVFISYSISMIPPWRESLPVAFRAVKPGGSLHIVDFGQQTRLPKAFRAVLHAWLAKFDVTPRPDLEEELRKLAAETGAELKFEHLFRDYAHHAILRKTG